MVQGKLICLYGILISKQNQGFCILHFWKDWTKNSNNELTNEKVFYIPFNALLGYIGTATSKRMKWRSTVLSDASGMRTATLTTTPRWA